MDNPVTELLKKALAELGEEGQFWVQGSAAMRFPNCCLGVALDRAARPSDFMQSYDDARELLISVCGTGIIQFNDTPGRTFAEVKEVYLKAIAESEKIVSR